MDTGVVISESESYKEALTGLILIMTQRLAAVVCRESNNNNFLYRNDWRRSFTKITNTPLTSNGESWSSSWVI
ncbi:MAG: hypothetical protein R3A12_13535 [Ignavibacteria bacterium]